MAMTGIGAFGSGVVFGLGILSGFLVGGGLIGWLLLRELKRMELHLDSAIRRAEVMVLAERVFGHKAKAMRWMSKPKQCFEGKSPLQAAESDEGARHVKEILLKIEEALF